MSDLRVKILSVAVPAAFGLAWLVDRHGESRLFVGRSIVVLPKWSGYKWTQWPHGLWGMVTAVEWDGALTVAVEDGTNRYAYGIPPNRAILLTPEEVQKIRAIRAPRLSP